MTVRPAIDDELVEQMNEELDDVMAIDPREVGVNKKLSVLLSEYKDQRTELRTAKLQQNSNDAMR